MNTDLSARRDDRAPTGLSDPSKSFEPHVIDLEEPKPGSDAWFTTHGIDPEVARERPYVPYEQGAKWVKDHFVGFPPSKENYRKRLARYTAGLTKRKPSAKQLPLGTVTTIVNQSAGLLMPKHPMPGCDPIPPQLRPHRAVFTNRMEVWHYHGPLGPHVPRPTWPDEAPEALRGKKMPHGLLLKGEAAEKHVLKGKPEDDDYSLDGTGCHKGWNQAVPHRHRPRSAKYVLLGQNERIDFPPRSRDLLSNAQVVFVSMEGTPKTDALLSQGVPACGMPSVTMGDAREIEHLAALIHGKVAFLVPDADWHQNDAVDVQALYLRQLLRKYVVAHIVAPPVEDGQQECLCKLGRDFGSDLNAYSVRFVTGSCSRCTGFAKGADDALGGGLRLEDFHVRGKEVPLTILQLRFGHRSTEKRAIKALERLILTASTPGRHCRSLASLAAIMDVGRRGHKDRLVDTLLSLHEAIEIEGNLELETKPAFRGSKVMVTDWKHERPTLTIKPEYRAVVQDPVTLGDFWERVAWQQMRQELDQVKEDVRELRDEHPKADLRVLRASA